jgi:hypothetical protein
LPNTTIGSGRTNGTSGVITDELAAAWGVPKGAAVNLGRDLIGDFKTAGFTYVSNFTELQAVPANANKLLGLFTFSNMNVAMDKVFGVDLTKNAQYDAFKGLSPRALAPYSEGKITDDALKALDAALATVKG